MFVFNDRWRTLTCAACSAGGRARASSCLIRWKTPMKHAFRAVIAVALGAGLAAAAQAQGIVNQAQGTLNQQSGLSGSSMQSGAPASNMQAAAPAAQTKRAATKIRPPSTRLEIRQVQLRLKSEGLLKG